LRKKKENEDDFQQGELDLRGVLCLVTCKKEYYLYIILFADCSSKQRNELNGTSQHLSLTEHCVFILSLVFDTPIFHGGARTSRADVCSAGSLCKYLSYHAHCI
jgi:hypothetical protein